MEVAIKALLYKKRLARNITIDDDANKYIKLFLKHLLTLVEHLRDNLSKTGFDNFTTVVKKVGKVDLSDMFGEINNFIMIDYAEITKEREFSINYMVSMLKLFEVKIFPNETRDDMNIEDESRIDQEGIEVPKMDSECDEDQAKTDYYLLLTRKVPLSYITYYYKNLGGLYGHFRLMFKIASEFYDKYVKSYDLEAFFMKASLPCIMYETTFDGSVTEHHIIVDKFFESRVHLNPSIREKYQKSTNKLLLNVRKVFKKYHIDTLDVASIAKAGVLLQDVAKELKEVMDTKDLVSLGNYLIEEIGASDELDSENKKTLNIIGSVFIEGVNAMKKNQQNVSDEIEMLYKTIKKYFYDPNTKIPKEYRDQIKVQTKSKFKSA